MEKIIAAAIVVLSVVLCSAAGAFDLQGRVDAAFGQGDGGVAGLVAGPGRNGAPG